MASLSFSFSLNLAQSILNCACDNISLDSFPPTLLAYEGWVVGQPNGLWNLQSATDATTESAVAKTTPCADTSITSIVDASTTTAPSAIMRAPAAAVTGWTVDTAAA